MKVLAIGGVPSVDLSLFVAWLNRITGVAITNEARVFSLSYEVIERTARNSWLLHADMTGILQEALQRDLPSTFAKLYARLAQGQAPTIWGDAHAHYLDPLDKPHFVDFFFRSFPQGRFVAVLENPLDCIQKLLSRTWVPSSWDAADVTARHVVAAEKAARDYPKAVSIFQVGSAKDNWDQARALQGWLADDNPDLLDYLIWTFSIMSPASEESVDLETRTLFEDRLAYWRAELKI